jgi:site-specific recombinase XerD
MDANSGLLAVRRLAGPTQIYTRVLDERMKAMVRDLHPLVGE